MRRSLLRLAEHASHHAHPTGGVGSAPHVHPPAPIFRYSAIALGASTWFYILYKAKNDGPVLLVLPCPINRTGGLPLTSVLVCLMDVDCRDGDTPGIMGMVMRMVDMKRSIPRHIESGKFIVYVNGKMLSIPKHIWCPSSVTFPVDNYHPLSGENISPSTSQNPSQDREFILRLRFSDSISIDIDWRH